MQQSHDIAILYLIGAIYAFTFWLILRQIDVRLKVVGKIKCRIFGHKYKPKDLKCSVCGKTKDRSHLKFIQGGKKDLGTPFRW